MGAFIYFIQIEFLISQNQCKKAASWYLVLLGCAEHWGLRLTIRILKQLA